MKLDFVRREVLDFLDREVKPLYKTFDKAHNLSHYKFVTNNCVNYACALIKRGEKVNREIAYVVGALHDVGIKDGREGHAKSSGLWVRENKELEKFFDKDVIKLISNLNKREQEIIKRRFGIEDAEPKTLEQIGKTMGFSKERIRQLENIAIQKLRKIHNIENLKSYLDAC